ncbi:MAG: phage tail tube protein [Candidatus Cryosericum sp.]
MARAKGALSKVVIDFESAIKTPPETPAGVVVPFNYPFSLGGEIPLKKADNTNLGRRDAAMPFYGNKDVKGSITVPLDTNAIGYWLRGLLGAPVTTPPASDTIDNAAAVDKVGDFVGIPITGHSFVAGERVNIKDTTHYNGIYAIESVTANEIVIPAVYVAETFAGDEEVESTLYTHVFKPGADVPSFLVDREFGNITTYLKAIGVKVNKFAVDYGGDGELVAKLDLVGCDESIESTAYDASPTALAFTRFQNRQAALEEGGGVLTTWQNGKFEINNNLATDDYVQDGSDGVRYDVPEGDCTVSGSLKTVFKDQTLLNKALTGTESSQKVVFTQGLNTLTFLFRELLYAYKSPEVVKGGLWVESSFEAFYEDGAENSIVVVTLVNSHASYA